MWKVIPVVYGLIWLVGSVTPLGDWVDGRSTFYNGIDGGNCGYGTIATASFPYGYIAAPNTAFYADAATCGECYEVTCAATDGCCTGTNVVIQISDQCPAGTNTDWCADVNTDHFDLSASAFAVIANPTCGVVVTQYRRVECEFTTNVKIVNKDGINEWWYALFVYNAAGYGDISTVELLDSSSGATFVTGARQDYNAWIFESSAGFTQPFQIRLSNSNDETITSNGYIVNTYTDYDEFDFGSNFATGNTIVTEAPVIQTTPLVVVDGTIAPDVSTTAAVTQPTEAETTPECLTAAASNFVWTSEDHVLKLNGERFNMKAASWFGFETSNCVVHGLWSVSYTSLLDFLVDNDFNAVRIPITVYAVADGCVPSGVDSGQNAGFPTDSFLSALDFVIEACAERGILVMLDMHSLIQDDYQTSLWYSDTYSEDTVKGVWTTLATRYADTWNVFAADVFNEPHGGTWGDGASTDWKVAAEEFGNAIHDAGADWLIMVQGIANGCSPENCFWGENLEGVASNPVTLNTADKVVYSPHTYGPSVYQQSYFSASNYPDNMPDIWEDHFGYIADASLSGQTPAIAVGEWGGTYEGTTQQWMDEFVDYLLLIDAPDTFFWCLNPNSGDTGGLLANDWSTPETAKLELLATLQPNPTLLSYDGELNQVCYGSASASTGAPESTIATPDQATTQSGGVVTEASVDTTQDGNVPTTDGSETEETSAEPESTEFNFECEWTDDYILGSVNTGVSVDGGNCGYGEMDNDTFPYRKVASFGTEVWSDSLACGMCLEVRCVGSDNTGDDPCYDTESTIIAMIGNRGATCETYDCMGLSAEAYDELADDTVNGMAQMEYRRVECPIDDNIVIVNSMGANRWWYSVVIENVGGAGVINSARLRDDATDATWVDGSRSSANSWVFYPGTAQSNVFTPPYTIELTDDTGETLTSTSGVLVESSTSMAEFDFGDNFDTLVGDSLYIDEYCASQEYDPGSDASSIVYSKVLLLGTLLLAFIF